MLCGCTQPGRIRPDVGHAPFLVGRELTLAGDRCSKRATRIVEFDNDHAKCRVKSHGRIGGGRRRRHRSRRRARGWRDFHLGRGIAGGTHRSDWLNRDIIGHGRIDRVRRTVLVLGILRFCAYPG
jgi:hypothetical protein